MMPTFAEQSTTHLSSLHPGGQPAKEQLSAHVYLAWHLHSLHQLTVYVEGEALLHPLYLDLINRRDQMTHYLSTDISEDLPNTEASLRGWLWK